MTPVVLLRRGPCPASRAGILGQVKKALPLVLGAVMVVVGLVWTLQGLGYIAGSPMTGVTLWAVVGPLVAVIGLALMIVGMRRRD